MPRRGTELQPVAVVLVNLDSAQDRREHMAAQLERLGVRYSRVGIDLRRVPAAAMQAHIDAIAPALRFDRKRLSGAEIGCWLSHLCAWQSLFTDTRARAGVVLEDDTLLSPTFADAAAAIARDGVADVVFLGTSSRNVSRRKPAAASAYNVHRPRGAVYNTWAYVIRRDYAVALLRSHGDIRWPIDHVLGGGVASLRPRVGVLMPAVVREDPVMGARSQIQPTTRRLDRLPIIERARRRVLASGVADLYYALYRWL